MAGSQHDDDESVLDISEQTNRPYDVALNQQRVNSWHPILDPIWVAVTLILLGVILVPTGLKMDWLQSNVVVSKVYYDHYENTSLQICGINNTYNANRTCNITLRVDRDMDPPVLVYYELTNFHQNYRKYTMSRDDYQLLGAVSSVNKVERKNCEPLNRIGNTTLNPCGLIANTFFNDYFTLQPGGVSADTGEPLTMIETGIAWPSDVEYMYKQPDGFRYGPCPNSSCDASCCDADVADDGSRITWSCTTPWRDVRGGSNGTCYRYFYPDDGTTQYLYETYPDIISPIEGVTNEHFIVWMRVATQPNFQKLYGWFDQPIAAGTALTFTVNANYAVQRFKGSKALLVTTNTVFGGRNIYTGPCFYGVGAAALAFGVFVILKQTVRPRKLGDRQWLHYKED